MMEIGQSCWRIWSGVSGYRKWLTTLVAWSLDDGQRVFASKVVSLTPQRQFVRLPGFEELIWKVSLMFSWAQDVAYGRVAS